MAPIYARSRHQAPQHLHHRIRRRKGGGRPGAVMEFHVIKKAGGPGEADLTAHIMTTSSRGSDDTSPLQLISAEQLSYYRSLETVVLAFADSLGALVPSAVAADTGK